MDLGIAGKKALVCAASKGIGRAAAVALAREGVQLYICSRDMAQVQATADTISEETGQPVFWQVCNLTDFTSREELIQSVQANFGTIDILIHNVGGPKPSTVEETQLDDWQEGFNRLFLSVAHLNEAFLPGMKEQRWGRILAVTSLSPLEPIPNLAISNAIRSAVTSMLKTLSDEVARYNISVNTVAPGLILTDRTEERLQDLMNRQNKSREEIMVDFTRSVPMGRIGSPEEMGSVIAFLCSQQASYITGSTLSVDGGKRRSTY